jgi:hypothetical protein
VAEQQRVRHQPVPSQVDHHGRVTEPRQAQDAVALVLVHRLLWSSAGRGRLLDPIGGLQQAIDTWSFELDIRPPIISLLTSTTR